MRVFLAILISMLVGWGSVAGAMAQVSAPMAAATMGGCAGKAPVNCPCKDSGMKCSKAACAQVCGQFATSSRDLSTVVCSAAKPAFFVSARQFSAVAPGFDPPIPKL